MEDKLVTIAEFSTAFDAELAKVRLENEGIEAIIVGQDLVANMFTIDAIKIELQVFEKDAEKAEAILANPPEDLDGEEDEEEESWEDSEEDGEDDFDMEGDQPE